MKKIVLIFGFCLYGLGYSNVVQPIAFFVSNDNLSFPFSDAAQTATANVLTNDTVNGVAFTPPVSGVTVAQVSSSNAGVSINPQGFITVAGGTPAGTYTLVYNFTTPCGTSNNATVTVEVTTPSVIFDLHPKGFGYSFCFNSSGYSIPNIYFNPSLNIGYGAYNFLINGVPISSSNVTVHLAPGETLPTGLSLSEDGTITVAPNYFPAVEEDLHFWIRFRSIANPNVYSEPMRTSFQTDTYFNEVYSDFAYFDTNGNWISGATNVLTNDRIGACGANPGTVATPPANCTLVFDPALVFPFTNNISIAPNGQIMVITTGLSPGLYYVKYKLCHPTLPNYCSSLHTLNIWIQQP